MHAEHAQFARLLNLLDRQITAFHEGEQPNYELMHDIVFNPKHYADRFHHPAPRTSRSSEFASKDPAMRSEKRLLQEHRVIDAHGSALLERLAQVSSDTLAPRGELESAAATYLVYYRHHLMAEERDIIPRAATLMTDADWAAVLKAVPSGADPLFGPTGALQGTAPVVREAS